MSSLILFLNIFGEILQFNLILLLFLIWLANLLKKKTNQKTETPVGQ